MMKVKALKCKHDFQKNHELMYWSAAHLISPSRTDHLHRGFYQLNSSRHPSIQSEPLEKTTRENHWRKPLEKTTGENHFNTGARTMSGEYIREITSDTFVS